MLKQALISAALLVALSASAAPAAHAETRQLSSAAPIAIADLLPATPYPASIQVSGMSGEVSKVVATISGISHPTAYDLDVLLVAPNGSSTMLMGSRCHLLDGAGFVFDDFAFGRIPPQGSACPDGAYKPADSTIRATSLPAPAPAGPYGQTMRALNGSNPNGAWKLFVSDARVAGSGSIAGGWSLGIATVPSKKAKRRKPCAEGKQRRKKTGKCAKKRHRRGSTSRS